MILGLLDADTFMAVKEYQSVDNVIDSKGVFYLKKDELGHTVKFEARLVARGFKQRERIGFSETFAPTVPGSCVRFLTAIACISRRSFSPA